MSQKYCFNQYLHCYSQVFLASASVLVALTIPSFFSLSGSQLMAQTAATQDLEAAGLYQQGVVRYSRGDFQGGEMLLRQALQIDPNLAAARTYLGNIMLRQNRLDAAIQEYAEAVHIDPNFAEGYFNLGLGLYKQGQREAAVTAYRQALVVNPTMAAAHYNMGLALYEMGQVGDAIASYQKGINLDSSNTNAFYNLGIALQKQGQTQEAMNAYREALQINPSNVAAYNNLAGLMVSQGQTTNAIAIYQEAIRKVPNNPDAYYNLGMTWYNQSEYKKASSAFKRAQKQYREVGNYELAEKMTGLIQQTAQGRSNPSVTTQAPTPTQTSTENPQNNEPIQSSEATGNNENNPNTIVEFEQPIPGALENTSENPGNTTTPPTEAQPASLEK
jgi:tetratricopeptide (TPR) repeat protein